jgi:U5 small nuclear ribonucleoprotein component
MSFPEMIRNVAVVGHLHHGKTALVDMLVFETHKLGWNADTQACLPSQHFCPLYIYILTRHSPV